VQVLGPRGSENDGEGPPAAGVLQEPRISSCKPASQGLENLLGLLNICIAITRAPNDTSVCFSRRRRHCVNQHLQPLSFAGVITVPCHKQAQKQEGWMFVARKERRQLPEGEMAPGVIRARPCSQPGCGVPAHFSARRQKAMSSCRISAKAGFHTPCASPC